MSEGYLKLQFQLQELQTDFDLLIKSYSKQRTHSGNHCFGKTPKETFSLTKHLALDKMLGRDLAAYTNKGNRQIILEPVQF